KICQLVVEYETADGAVRAEHRLHRSGHGHHITRGIDHHEMARPCGLTRGILGARRGDDAARLRRRACPLADELGPQTQVGWIEKLLDPAYLRLRAQLIGERAGP